MYMPDSFIFLRNHLIRSGSIFNNSGTLRNTIPFLALVATLAATATASLRAWEIDETDETIRVTSTYTSILISKTRGELLEIGFRSATDQTFDTHAIRIFGRRQSSGVQIADTASITPNVRMAELANHLIIKMEIRQNGLFWNFWYDLDDASNVIQASRFVYGEQKSLTLRGVGVAFDAPDYAAQTHIQSYTALGGDYMGGYIDFKNENTGVRAYVSNMDEQQWETSDTASTLWCRPNATDWGTRIDYRRFVLTPIIGGESLANSDRYAQLFVFDHELTNVELVGSWILREKNRNGHVRNWFNSENYGNGFIPGTGTPSTTNLSGYWRDDWTTGALLRGLKLIFDVTADPFYFTRFIDLLDYQIDRDHDRLQVQWGINNAWNENYPMGRIEAAMDAYELTDWIYYRDIAVNSEEWYLTNEDFVPGAGHNTYFNIDYLDLSYCMEGLYRADAWNHDLRREMINDWWENIDKVTWNAAHGLYGHNLGSGLTDHWARGHGWWFETFSNILPYYDGDNAAAIQAHYKTAAAKLIQYQDGIWHSRIDQPQRFLDASAGSMIASGMAMSFLTGDLGVDALESAIEAISTLTNDYLMEDGTLIGTDRGGSSGSPDPFPYTQEAYVRFARDLGIREIVSPKTRNTLSTFFTEGVMITDKEGGTLTDAADHTISADGRIILDAYSDDLHYLRVLGSGQRNLTIQGFESNRTYTATDDAITAGTRKIFAVTADENGTLDLSLTLTGEHDLSLYPRATGTIWAEREINSYGFMWFDGFGWVYETWWPYVWMSNVGWTYVFPASQPENMWIYDFNADGWRWTHTDWDGWYYNPYTISWDRYGT